MDMTPTEHKRLDIAGLWFPLTTVLALASTIAWFSWNLSSERAAIYQKIERTDSRIDSLAESVKQLADVLRSPNKGNFTWQQWTEECLRLEILNPSWVCTMSPKRNQFNTSIETTK